MSCAPAEPGPSLDRNPPQDIDAEKSVLGAMLSSKDAIADVGSRSSSPGSPPSRASISTALDTSSSSTPSPIYTVAATLPTPSPPPMN